MFYSTGQSLVVLDLFGPKVVFCMFFDSHDSSTAADIEIEGGSTQNS